MWRGSLLPLGCAAVANPAGAVCRKACERTASRSSGSKLPRHKTLLAQTYRRTRQSGNDLPRPEAYNARLSFPLFGTSEPA
ncbi:hypothetical protein EMIT0P171_110033 [Pseudomonas sp. IT-P171]